MLYLMTRFLIAVRQEVKRIDNSVVMLMVLDFHEIWSTYFKQFLC